MATVAQVMLLGVKIQADKGEMGACTTEGRDGTEKAALVMQMKGKIAWNRTSIKLTKIAQ